MSFLTLYLLEQGVGQADILLIFCSIFLVSGLIIRAQRLRYSASLSFIPIALAATASCAAAIGLSSVHPGLAISVAALCVMTLKDMATTNAVTDVHGAAHRAGIPPTTLVSTGMLIGALLMIICLAGMGYLLDQSPSGWLIFGLVVNLAMLAALMRGAIHIKAPEAQVIIPPRVRSIVTLTLFYNATNFVGRRFVLPLAVASMAQSLGLGDQAYSSLGMILSLLVLLGFATRSLSKRPFDPHLMMFSGFMTGLVLWIILALAVASEMSLSVAALALACLFMIEITAKVWTLGFIEVLRIEADKVGGSPRSDVQLAYFGFFMEMKSYGAGLGFVAALLSFQLGVSVIIPAAGAGLLAGAWVLRRSHQAVPA